jgi:hypothetical protein
VPAGKVAALQQRHAKAISAALQTRCAQQLQLTEQYFLRLLCVLHWNGYVVNTHCNALLCKRMPNGVFGAVQLSVQLRADCLISV